MAKKPGAGNSGNSAPVSGKVAHGRSANGIVIEPGADDDTVIAKDSPGRKSASTANNDLPADGSGPAVRAKPETHAGPQAPTRRNIVIFSDGTGQEGGVGNNTNVYALFNMILDRSPTQISYYDQGLGTGNNRFWGSIAGHGISDNVYEAYQFLSDNFNAGDRLYLFGFSRGATTVRTLSGFIHMFGILPKSRPELFHRAWDIYRIRNKDKRRERAEEFVHRNHTMWTEIRFLGVWDTVAALGAPIKVLDAILNLIPYFRHSYHEFKMAPSVEYGRHALAIDDERLIFHPVLWDEQGARKKAPSLAGGDLFSINDVTDVYLVAKTLNDNQNPVSRRVCKRFHQSTVSVLKRFHALEGRVASPKEEDEFLEAVLEEFNGIIESGIPIFDAENGARRDGFAKLDVSGVTQDQIKKLAKAESISPREANELNRLLLEDVYSLKPRIKQVWFAGMHSDVGGGYADSELAQIPLLWMVGEAVDLGLKIYPGHKVDLRPSATGKMHDSRAGLGGLYRRRARHWDPQRHQGRPPLVHESVKERARAVRGYKPWILKTDYEIEPWPERLQSSIQYDNERIWRSPVWGWGAAFDKRWSEIERISSGESKTAITFHLKGKGPIQVQGSLPRSLQDRVDELERTREHNRLRKVDENFNRTNEKIKSQVESLQDTVDALNRYIAKDEGRAKDTEDDLRELKKLESRIAQLERDLADRTAAGPQ